MAEASSLDVTAFGAMGDGQADDTAAVQRALDAAGEVRGTVAFPPGVYACGTLRAPSHVGLAGGPAWSYRDFGGAVLQLADERAACLLDLTGSVGVTVNGLGLDGGGLGEGVHGIMIDKPDYGKAEDNPRIERCKVARFSGDAVHLNRIWCFSVRHCMLAYSGGRGLYVRGWDGFILDNWFSGNRGAGYGGYVESASVTMTGNRVEWNGAGNIVIVNGSHYNICNNYLDRAGGTGISITNEGDYWGKVFAITGNVINRSGKPGQRRFAEYESAQAVLRNMRGLTFTGNTMTVGRDDGNKGTWSPEYGIVYEALAESVVRGNALYEGAIKELLVDLGGHGEGLIVADNPGCRFAGE